MTTFNKAYFHLFRLL